MATKAADVAVIIPTSGRQEVLAAIRSALSQTLKPAEIIVVYDGEAKLIPPHLKTLGSEVKVIATGRKSNANVARNLGVLSAGTNFVALLDDDDEWASTKLERQLAGTIGPHTLSCTSVIAVDRQSEVKWSSDAITAGQTAIDYLFTKRRLGQPPRVLQTSTWVANRALLEAFPFDESLLIHQDLDWLAKAAARGVQVTLLLEPLTRYRVTGVDSVTKRSRWKESAAWLAANREYFTPAQAGRFTLMLPQSFAARNGDVSASWMLIARACRVGWPGLVPLLMATRRAIIATIRR